MTDALIKYTRSKGRFVLPNQRPNASLGDVAKWQMSGGRAKWPKWVENRAYPPPPQKVEGAGLSVTWIGHATALIQTAGMNILTDPFFSQRTSPSQLFGPARVRAPGLGLHALPPIDLILLSHTHYDHLDKPALNAISRRHTAHLVTGLGTGRHVKRFKARELDWHEGAGFGPLKITALPTLHWTRRGLFDTNTSLWCAFMIEGPAGPVYFGADTGFGQGDTFREVNRLFGRPRLSLLPIGAYEPRWFMAPQHMNPEEAVMAHELLGSRQSLAIHHGTIQLTDEAIDAPALALDEALAAHGLTRRDFLVPDVGETVKLQ
jgi:L-ascorbate metabolism protein UlaG (beta-lactamase superfamily)